MKKFLFIAVVLFGIVAAFIWFNNDDSGNSQGTDQAGSDNSTNSSESNSDGNSGQLITFTGDEFKQLYDSLALPNTIPIIEAPEITGNPQVDDYIQNKAELRGYKLRSVPSSDLDEVEGVQLQNKLINDWRAMKSSAKVAGINLEIRSGWRSVEEQRELFLEQLFYSGVSFQNILSGAADNQIDQILKTVSPPGYSRHHSGYTIDLADTSARVFEYSEGYKWISADNFANAKKFGFIPGYPDDASNQGPEPEPWEYVWANRSFVIE